MTCSKCDRFNGYIRFDDPESFYGESFRRCDCGKNEEMQKLIEKSQLDEYVSKSLDNYKTYDPTTFTIKDRAVKYLKEPDKSFMLLGTVGVGKTHVAAALANNLLARSKSVIYFIFHSEIRKIQGFINTPEYPNYLAKFQQCDYLVIDELFKGTPTASEKKIIYEIINHRYIAKKQVIVTSEHSLDGIMEIDEAIGSRLYEMAGNDEFICNIKNGNNYRLRKVG